MKSHHEWITVEDATLVIMGVEMIKLLRNISDEDGEQKAVLLALGFGHLHGKEQISMAFAERGITPC